MATQLENSIQALIFDFDGLVLETEEPVYQSWQELFQSFNCYLAFDTWAEIIGKAEGSFDPMTELERQLGYPLDRAKLAPRRRQRELDLIASQPVLPGVEAYLQAGQRLGLKLGMASSSSCAWVTGHLERLGLRPYFDCIKASDDVRQAKPDPELYLAVLAEFKLCPEQAIVFEDSAHGITAAQRAGIFTVAVPNPLTRRLDLDHADLRLASLAEITLENLLDYVADLRGSSDR